MIVSSYILHKLERETFLISPIGKQSYLMNYIRIFQEDGVEIILKCIGNGVTKRVASDFDFLQPGSTDRQWNFEIFTIRLGRCGTLQMCHWETNFLHWSFFEKMKDGTSIFFMRVPPIPAGSTSNI